MTGAFSRLFNDVQFSMAESSRARFDKYTDTVCAVDSESCAQLTRIALDRNRKLLITDFDAPRHAETSGFAGYGARIDYDMGN